MAPADAFERALGALGARSARAPSWRVARRARARARPRSRRRSTRLIEAGALDDERFARRYAEDKRELRGWGPERIREALAARGVAERH